MRSGVTLRDGPTRPAEIRRVDEPRWLWPREPPIRLRRHIPTRWLRVTLREGRNRQVRRITAHVGYPTLRLIRWSVGPFDLSGLAPGHWREASPEEMISLTERSPHRPPGPRRIRVRVTTVRASPRKKR